ncbi:hypothetical protein SO802_016337 [Lithocarpus litseifolius]|uniref:Reverse transcriptase zinc-binding domain-containing protein n=1 Tax=Lithocarpus litseifolius TaxID=425828 RepID=A0AAW2D1N2_9ROSI
MFTPEEAELIKSIPLSRCEVEDTLFWPFTSNGVYTSKSGYRFLKAEVQTEWDEEQMTHDKVLWRTLWSLQVPKKIKNLVWRACKNSLPTKDNLVRRTIIKNLTCDRCKQVRMSQPNISVHRIPSSAKERVAEFAMTQLAPTITWPDLTSVRAKWRPPSPDVVKINCDGATFKEQKKLGIGVMIRDNNGLVMSSISKLLP